MRHERVYHGRSSILESLDRGRTALHFEPGNLVHAEAILGGEEDSGTILYDVPLPV
jgi:hypothetical protein